MKPVIVQQDGTEGLRENAPVATLYYGQNVLDSLRLLPAQSVHVVCTSPPFWGLRDYKTPPQSWPEVRFKPLFDQEVVVPAQEASLGLESDPQHFVGHLVEIFREVRRVLRDDGTVWLNLGDSYSRGGRGGAVPAQRGLLSNDDYAEKYLFESPTAMLGDHPQIKTKDLVGIPWLVAFALRADGWYLRSDIIWNKPNPMPESVKDRPTKAHEYVFLLTKSASYYYDAVAIMEQAKYGEQHANKTTSWGNNRKHPNKSNVADYAFKGDNHTTTKMVDGSYGRNARSVWSIPTEAYPGAHFATFPTELPRRAILAGTSEKGCCSKCLSPLQRLTEVVGIVQQRWGKTSQARMDARLQTMTGGMKNEMGATTQVKRTIDWESTCDCPEGTDKIPCTVLDPFSGSATTGAVALRLGQNYIGCDLQPDYLDLAVARLEGRIPLSQNDENDENDDDNVLDLFA